MSQMGRTVIRVGWHTTVEIFETPKGVEYGSKQTITRWLPALKDPNARAALMMMSSSFLVCGHLELEFWRVWGWHCGPIAVKLVSCAEVARGVMEEVRQV